MICHHLPTIFAGDLNARHPTFGYNSDNTKGKALDRLVRLDKLNYVGPEFNTFFTRNSATKPDCILTNHNFYLNHHITPGGLGPSDHLTINIKISTNPIIVPCTPIKDINNVDWEKYKTQLGTAEEININGTL